MARKHWSERKRIDRNPFKEVWGVTRFEIAAIEGVTPDNISMRLLNFGTPWQRRAKPTRFELLHSRTRYEIAEELNVHPGTVECHMHNSKNAYIIPERRDGTGPGYWNLGKGRFGDSHWRDMIQSRRYTGWCPGWTWLMPQHPDYEAWRLGKLFPNDYIGGSSWDYRDVDKHMEAHNWPRYNAHRLIVPNVQA